MRNIYESHPPRVATIINVTHIEPGYVDTCLIYLTQPPCVALQNGQSDWGLKCHRGNVTVKK